MLISLPAMVIRGGTSKGVYLLRDDVEQYENSMDILLTSVMGADPRQINGIGGATTTTSKVAIVGPSAEKDIDVDYRFAQVDPPTGTVDWSPTCGNLLAGVGPFAIERGLVAAEHVTTTVRVRLSNTGARVVLTVCTSQGNVEYQGRHAIPGVAGSAAPVQMAFTDFAGGATGRLLPTGNPMDVVDGCDVTCIDAGVCAVLVRARDFGLTGAESPAVINDSIGVLDRVEAVRRKAGELMGMGDVSGTVLPKVMLLSESDSANIRSRYLVPASCHPAHALSGAINLASAALISETIAHGLTSKPVGSPCVTIEHPAGVIEVNVTMDGAIPVEARLTSTARKLFDGTVFCEIVGGRDELVAS